MGEGGGPIVIPIVLTFNASRAINMCGLHKTYYTVCPSPPLFLEIRETSYGDVQKTKVS